MCRKLKPHMVEKPQPKPRDAESFHRKERIPEDNVPSPSRSTERSGISSSQFSKATISSGSSLSNLRESVLPENPILYGFREITEATNQFSRGRFGKSSVWKSSLRGKTVMITDRRLKTLKDFRSGLRQICSAHHSNIIKLLGGCCEGEHIYLVYDYVEGASLGDCLRSTKMPGFTILKTWISRMQIAVDVAQGLEYLHHDTNINYVHNYLKSSSIIITEPDYRARICHVGASYLAGEYDFDDTHKDFDPSKGKAVYGEITEEGKVGGGMELHRRSKSLKITGTQGYMAPEYVSSGIVSQKNDVFAFGVILLELLSAHEPVRYVTKANRQMERVSLIESVNRIISDQEGGEFRSRLRFWIDHRLKDSYPVDCAEKVAKLAASCVDFDPDRRPDMRRVAGKLSDVFIRSQQWHEKMRKEAITDPLEAR